MSRLPGPRGPRAVLSLAWRLNADPYTTLPAMLHDYGPVIEFGRGRYKYIYLLSPEANEHILVGDPANFTWKEALQVPLWGTWDANSAARFTQSTTESAHERHSPVQPRSRPAQTSPNMPPRTRIAQT